LDLSFAKIEFPLLFANCQFTDRVNLSFAYLDGLTIEGSVMLGIDVMVW
jgi:hypothetical protein